MHRLTFSLLAASSLLAACTPAQTNDRCASDNPPAACSQTCDPTSATNSCPAGFHCGPQGTCLDDGPVDPGVDANCPEVHFMAKQTIPSITLLIDRSGSMTNGIGGKSRYQAVRDALVDGTSGVVTNLQNKAFFGAALYSSDNPCPRLYSVARSMNNRNGIANLINNQSPNGNTPTGPSIDQVVADFAANPPPLDSPPIIVLASDGLPNTCNDGNDTATGQNLSINAAKNAFAAGIRLFMLGVGNGINDNHLQAMANAGAGVQAGMPNAPYFLANSPAELQTAFDTIIGGVLSCELALNGTVDPQFASSGVVTLNGNLLTFGTDWELINNNTIRLIGAACDTLKSSPNPVVDATFSCGAIVR